MTLIEGFSDCGEKSDIYHVMNAHQGIIYLIMAVFYILGEAYLIAKTVEILKTQSGIIEDITKFCFFLCLHVLLIRTILYLLGGVIFCYPNIFFYPAEVYSIIDEYCYKFKRSAIILITYRFMSFLSRNGRLLFSQYQPERLLIIIEIVDLIIYTCLYIISRVADSPRRNLSFYNLTIDTIIFIIFLYCSIKLLQQSQLKRSFAAEFYLFMAIIISREIVHKHYEVLIFVWEKEYQRQEILSSLKWSLYNVLYCLTSEFIPCMAMLKSFTVGESKNVRVSASFARTFDSRENLTNAL